MKPQLIIPYAALSFALCAAGIAIFESREKKQEAFSYPSEPVEGTEFIIVQPIGENGLYQRLVERTIFRYEQGLWRAKETSIMDYDSTETRTNREQ